MEKRVVRIEVADPTVLGLFGLALVTLVAASQKLGLTSGVSYLVPWAFFLGGMGQLIASIFDFKHNNLFGASAFAAYGLFWIAMAFSWLIRMGCFGEKMALEADTQQLGFVFVGYLIFSIILTISSLKMSKAMFLLMSLICLLFVGLAIDSFTHSIYWHAVAAYAELAISLLTFYVLAAKYLNTFFGRELVKCGNPILK